MIELKKLRDKKPEQSASILEEFKQFIVGGDSIPSEHKIYLDEVSKKTSSRPTTTSE